MGSQLIEIPLEAGGSIVLVASDAELRPSVTRRGGSGSNPVERASRTFEEGVERVRPAVRSLVERLMAFPEQPEEIRVEFGIEFTAEAGAIIASASTTANFNVAMTWRSTANDQHGD